MTKMGKPFIQHVPKQTRETTAPREVVEKYHPIVKRSKGLLILRLITTMTTGDTDDNVHIIK